MRSPGLVAVAAALVLLATATTRLGEPVDAATTLPRTTLTATARDLGTLGGARSAATDIDGAVVVGTSNTAAGPEHAFAYDLTTSRMRDLGTLGGPSSAAVAIDGNVVAGNALTSDLKWHAFAYDLSTSTMHDLGALSGGSSFASDVDGTVVVGRSGHAFAYDLAAPAPAMKDLGALGTDNSAATAVDGDTVVGSAYSGVDEYRHAFAYNLSTSTMRDLGSLGFDFSQALAVDGDVVAGQSLTSRFRYGDEGKAAFVVDLASASSAMRDLGDLGFDSALSSAVEGQTVVGSSWTSASGAPHVFSYDLASPRLRDRGWLGGSWVMADDIRGGVVVGNARRAGDGRNRPFAIDLRASRPRLTDLGTLGGAEGSAVAVSGRTVAGSSTTSGGRRHATVWTLRTTTAPSFRLGRVRYVVQENARTARVTVLRDGNPNRAVSVRYAARDVSRPPGHDFVPVSGTFRFAAGQVRKAFSVRLRDDARREPEETFVLTLRSPTNGAILGTPSTAGLVIRASDQRPDAWVSSSPASSYAGNNVYNSTGAHQTTTGSAARTRTRRFFVRVYNDGNAVNTFVLRGSAARSGSKVRYRSDGADVTRSMRSTSGRRVRLGPGLFTQLEVRITPGTAAAVGSLKPAAVSATWHGDGARTDVVRAVVRVAR